MAGIDATHDPALRSWVTSANLEATDFPIQNLPFGRFRRGDTAWRIGVAIGDQVLDLKQAANASPWPDELHAGFEPLAAGNLNAFMALGPGMWRSLRATLSQALAEGSGGEFVQIPG